MHLDGSTPLLLLGVVLAACASPPSSPPADPAPAIDVRGNDDRPSVERAFLEGLSAARSGRFSAAVPALARVAEACAGTGVGDHARLALLGVLTDPRNPGRDLTRARRVAERWLASPSGASWMEPLIEAFYLVTLDLGGAPSAEPAGADRRRAGTVWGWKGSAARSKPVAAAPADDCENAAPSLDAREPRLPALPGRPLRDELSASERQRAELADLVERLEARVAELETELERIRKTLEP